MKYNAKRQRDLHSHKVIIDARSSEFEGVNGERITLSNLYKDIDSDDAVDRIRDSVRQLVQARINDKSDEFIADRKESLMRAIEDAAKWSRTCLKLANNQDLQMILHAEDIANAIDTRIIESIATHEAERAIGAASL